MAPATMSAMKLNPSQEAAAAHRDGPLLVLAGAGSGKTRVVTERIARLVAGGAPPWSIVAMTFTNKAAAEMKERVVHTVGAKIGKDIRVTTFHSFGLDFLAKEVRAVGFRGDSFTIFDQADATSAIREVLRNVDVGKKFDIGALLARISVAKNAFEDETTWKVREGDEYDEVAKEIFPRYRAALRAFQAFDFDDLVTESVRLMQRREDIRDRWRQKIRYLMVDEYQDTNGSQLELVRCLVGDHKNVMVVGDDDQSIYAWRGADVRNILDFEAHFAGAKVVKLEENYRSIGAVLSVANAVLANSKARRHGKILRATREQGPIVESVIAADGEVETEAIADEIKNALDADPTLRARDIAVLYRSNAQAEPIEIALRERGVAARVVGGQKFYERKEVKDLLAYLRVILVKNDEIALRRVLNYPARGIGDTSLERLSTFATAYDLTLLDAVEQAMAIDNLSPAAIDGCERFFTIIRTAREQLAQGVASAEVTRRLAETIGLRDDILAATPGEVAARRLRNIDSILQVLARRDAKGPADLSAVAEFVRFLSLQTDKEEEEQPDVVTLSTMHGAKGLEFRLVCIAGLEEGLMPHSRTLDTKAQDVVPADIEEERRLFYVAVTRARDRLVLFRAKFRVMRGKPAPRVPSRFLLEVPEELLSEREITKKSNAVVAAQMVKGLSGLLGALDGPMDGAARPTRRPPPYRR
jgi:ATP-dependent DNA helicase Rep